MMPMGRAERFETLFRDAEAQSGYFTSSQAVSAGYSARLLSHHAKWKHIERVGHGIYRLVHFPQVSDAEDLVVHWLWSDRQGVFSHETALQLHRLSDAMPARAYMTVPRAWERRRLRVPAGLVLRYDDVAPEERESVRGVIVTSPARTVNDCARAHVQPDFVQDAVREGLERGLFVEAQIGPAREYVQDQCG